MYRVGKTTISGAVGKNKLCQYIFDMLNLDKCLEKQMDGNVVMLSRYVLIKKKFTSSKLTSQ